MKKLMIALLVGAFLGSAAYAATSTVTNRLGQVFVVTTDDEGAQVTDVTLADGAAAMPERDFGSLIGWRVDTNAAFDTTLVVPRDIGDVLIGTVSGKVAVSYGFTTNDWSVLN